jgi:hypothetical protein
MGCLPLHVHYHVELPLQLAPVLTQSFVWWAVLTLAHANYLLKVPHLLAALTCFCHKDELAAVLRLALWFKHI